MFVKYVYKDIKKIFLYVLDMALLNAYILSYRFNLIQFNFV